MERARFAIWEIGAVAAALTILLLVMINRYGPHRDELYFVAAGQRLAWGIPTSPCSRLCWPDSPQSSRHTISWSFVYPA